jgi:ketosteroid isomerase-like protein
MQQIRLALLTLALTAGLTRPGTSQAPLSPQASIGTLRHEWNTALTMKDTARMGRLVLDSALFVSDRVELRGRDAVTATFGRLFANRPSFRLRFVIDTVIPQLPTGTDQVVSEYGTWEESWPADGGAVILRGTYYDVWRRQPEGWRIALHAFSVTSCSGNPGYCGRF